MDSHALSVDDVRPFLETHVGPQVHHVEHVGDGAWSRCFGFIDGGRERVIRFGRHLDDFQWDRRADAFARPELPIPAVLEIGEAFDAHFAISERVRGVPLESLETEAAWERVLPSLFAALDALRDADVSDTRGYGGWDGDGHAAGTSWRQHLLAIADDPPGHRTHGWRHKLSEHADANALFDRAMAALERCLPDEPGPRHLIHGDLLNRNALVADGRLTGIFDWGCSRFGDFLYDLAWMVFWAPWYPSLAALDVRSRYLAHCRDKGVDVPDADRRMQCCLLHIGLDHLAYNAHTGDADSLRAVARRMGPLLG